MADYLYSDDGKIHTRFSELARCTPGQIDQLIAERKGEVARVETSGMTWGTDRHDMWRDEALETGMTASCFPLQFPATHVEKEFVTEILPGIILHSRPDVVSVPECTLPDYKTLVADTLQEGIIRAHETYGRSRQLTTYSFQVGMHEIRIKRALYLIEIWNRQLTEILGYTMVEKKITFATIGAVLPWVKQRVSFLAAAMEGVLA